MPKKTKTSTNTKKPVKAASPKPQGKVAAVKSKLKSAKAPKATSVDEVILKYEKEQTTLNSQLAETRKMIQELESKNRKLQEDISALRTREQSIVSKVDEVDYRRDQEVSKILVKLGVQIGDSSGAISVGGPTDSASDEPPMEVDDKGDQNTDSNDGSEENEDESAE